MRTMIWLAWVLALGLTASLRADARADFMEAAEHQKSQRWAEAAQSYAKVTAQTPTYAPAWKQLASCRYYLGDLEGAEASAQRYLKLQPADTAFKAWDAQLRTKLKLDPLDLSTPVPTPMATAIPLDDAITANLPAPSADAEVADGTGFSSASAPATPGVQAQRVEEPASAFGLRLAGSFNLGMGHFEHGEQVNASTTSSGHGYPGQAGLGVGGLAELLYDHGSLWEFSFGTYPVSWSETQSSSQTDSVTRSNESTAKGLILPVLVGLGARFTLTPLITGILSLGLGIVPSAHVDVDDSTVQTTLSSLTNTHVKASVDYPLAPAWRLGAGMDVALGSHLSAYLGGQLLGAQFAAAEATYSVEVVDQSGATLFSASGLKATAQTLNVLSAGALAGLSLRY